MGVNLFLIEILVIAVLLVGVIAVLLLRRTDHRDLVKPLAEPVEALPPVLLPEATDIRPEDLDNLRFSTGIRGYRADQVDEVLDRLVETLAHREAQIEQLGGTVHSTPPATDSAAPAATRTTDSSES